MSREVIHTGIRFDSKPEEISGTIASCIQEYRLRSLCLDYERQDNKDKRTASFTFWLSGMDVDGEELRLLYLQELPANFSSFVEQLSQLANEMNIRFENKFARDGYTISCQAIYRRMERGR